MSEQEQKNLIAIKAAQNSLINFSVVVDKKYQVNWHHKIIADKLQGAYEKVLRGERARIIIEMPPRHGKSEEASIKFPAWVLGKQSDFPIILASYAQDLATDFGLATRDLMGSSNYQVIFNARLRADTQAKAKWLTKDGGGYDAVGIGGPITGKGFKIGIIDDYIKNREEADSEIVRDKIWKWYKSTFLTREDGNGAVIVIATRWHDDDLIGRILQQAEKQGRLDEWDIIKFPAIAEKDEEFRKTGEALWPYRFPLEILEKRKQDLGPYEWSALYQQDPVDEESREFKQAWFRPRNFEEVLKLKTRRFITIDPAWAMRDKSDFIGFTINYVDRENNWNFRSFRMKMDSMELIKMMFKLNNEVNPEKFGMEEGAYRSAIKPFLDEEMKRRNEFFEIVELKHEQQAKNLRIRGLIPRYSSGGIFHIENECGDLEAELARFPKGVHDDTMDSAAYQLQIAEEPDIGDRDEEGHMRDARESRTREKREIL